MSSPVTPIPNDQPRLQPYLTVRNADAAIAFYREVFGAVETLRIPTAGKVGHAELQIGDARLMLSDEFPEYGALAPETVGGSPVTLSLYVEDVDAVAAKAEAAGAKFSRPVADQFYGDRGGKFTDPFGQVWWIASRKENITEEELMRRAAQHGG
jgi:PhnB protein